MGAGAGAVSPRQTKQCRHHRLVSSSQPDTASPRQGHPRPQGAPCRRKRGCQSPWPGKSPQAAAAGNAGSGEAAAWAGWAGRRRLCRPRQRLACQRCWPCGNRASRGPACVLLPRLGAAQPLAPPGQLGSGAAAPRGAAAAAAAGAAAASAAAPLPAPPTAPAATPLPPRAGAHKDCGPRALRAAAWRREDPSDLLLHASELHPAAAAGPGPCAADL